MHSTNAFFSLPQANNLFGREGLLLRCQVGANLVSSPQRLKPFSFINIWTQCSFERYWRLFFFQLWVFPCICLFWGFFFNFFFIFTEYRHQCYIKFCIAWLLQPWEKGINRNRNKRMRIKIQISYWIISVKWCLPNVFIYDERIVFHPNYLI